MRGQRQVGQRELVAMGIGARQAIGQLGLNRLSAFDEPVAHPLQTRRFIEPAFLFQIVAHPWHDEWVHVCAGDVSQGAHPGFARSIGWQQRVLRPGVVDVLHDGQGLCQAQAIMVQQGQHMLGVEAVIGLRELLALAQVNDVFLVGQALELQGGTHPEGGQRAPVTVQNKRHGEAPWV